MFRLEGGAKSKSAVLVSDKLYFGSKVKFGELTCQMPANAESGVVCGLQPLPQGGINALKVLRILRPVPCH
jgi:hypothetical protein